MTQIVADFGVLAHADYWKSGGLGFGEGLRPTPRLLFFTKAKRRAAVAVSGKAAERPMEPEAVRASLASSRKTFSGQDWNTR